MRLKTKLVLAITTLVFLVAGVLSLVYVSYLIHAAVQQSYDASHMSAQQIWLALKHALESGLKDRTVDPNDPNELRSMVATTVTQSAELASVIDSVNRYSLTVYDINVGDSRGNTLVSSNPDNENHPLPVRPDYSQLLNANPVHLMKTVFGPPRVYDVAIRLDNNGKLLATVHVGVRTTLLSASYAPLLRNAVLLMGFALGTALLVAFLLSNLALQPLEDISIQLDYWTAAGPVPAEDEEEAAPRQDMVAQVSTKIEMIGQRMRNVEEVFSALTENLNQLLGNLQDGILLFTGGGRAVVVSEAVHRFLQREQNSILGRQAWDIFDPATVLGRALLEAFEARSNVVKEEIRTETGRRIQASVDFIHDDESRDLGALVTLHDLEFAEEIESELELSRRMAAIGRLTSGVGHEVKNPINAIVVHLELLRSKLGEGAPGMRHLEVIDAEIRRLDRVVQTLVDFSRPVELQLREQDLRGVIGDVLALASDELSTHGITLVSRMPEEPLIANVDADLLKQAALNVIQNGAQAMPEGGKLQVILEEERTKLSANGALAGLGPRAAMLRIADTGPGIPDEIREKIFDLYFTTKTGGSGIGLAMTYRILQLHHGGVEVQSRVGEGTEFLLRIPLIAADRGRRLLQPVNAQI
jgi:signal transduction histidine kinase